MKTLILVLVTCICLPAVGVPFDATLASGSFLDLGYRQMYNLEFGEAHRTFRSWKQDHPDDPMGPTSDAAVYLFSEFDRLGVLQTELFVDDEKFNTARKLVADPAANRGFQDALSESEKLISVILARSPQDKNALFAKVLNMGLRSDYLALVEKRYLASIRYMKEGGALAQRLLALDRTNYDAYLAIGVENYILGLKPAPVRWALRLYGAEVDKGIGIEKLRLTAEKGHYLLPFARFLLAVAALRDNDPSKAREILTDLAREFPNNRLYLRELQRLQKPS